MSDKERTPEVVKASLPSNHPATLEADAPKKKMPREGVGQFKVRTRGAETFRRAGITFGPDPVVVDASSLSDDQRIELMNTPSLIVEEVGHGMAKAQAPEGKAPEGKAPEGKR